MITRITHTMKPVDGGGVFTVSIDFDGAAVALLGPEKLKAAARTAVWVMFGGVADSQHEYICHEYIRPPPVEDECRHGLPLGCICPRCCEEGL